MRSALQPSPLLCSFLLLSTLPVRLPRPLLFYPLLLYCPLEITHRLLLILQEPYHPVYSGTHWDLRPRALLLQQPPEALRNCLRYNLLLFSLLL